MSKEISSKYIFDINSKKVLDNKISSVEYIIKERQDQKVKKDFYFDFFENVERDDNLVFKGETNKEYSVEKVTTADYYYIAKDNIPISFDNFSTLLTKIEAEDTSKVPVAKLKINGIVGGDREQGGFGITTIPEDHNKRAIVSVKNPIKFSSDIEIELPLAKSKKIEKTSTIKVPIPYVSNGEVVNGRYEEADFEIYFSYKFNFHNEVEYDTPIKGFELQNFQLVFSYITQKNSQNTDFRAVISSFNISIDVNELSFEEKKDRNNEFEGDNNVFSIKGNEFSYSGTMREGKTAMLFIAEKIQRSFNNGKEFLTIRCSASPTLYSIGDIVKPKMYKGGNNEDFVAGGKEFIVLGTKLVFDGAVWQILSLREK